MTRNAKTDDYFAEYRRVASLAYDLDKTLGQMIEKKATEAEVLALLQKTPDEVFGHLHHLTALPVAGMHTAFAYVLSRGIPVGADVPPENHDPYKTGMYRIAMDSISGDYSRAMGKLHGDKAAQEKMRDDTLKGIDMLLDAAQKTGGTAERMIDLHLFTAHHNFDLLPGLIARGGDLKGTIDYLQRRANDGDQYATSPLHALEAYAVVSDNGKKSVPVAHEFNARALHDEAEKYVMPLINALKSGDMVTAETLITTSDIRQTLAKSLVGHVMEHAEHLLPVFLDHIKVGNMPAFTTHIIQEQMAGFFTEKDTPARGQKGLRLLDVLITRGGSVNGDNGAFLAHVAQNNRMDVVPQLVKRGAKVKTSLEYVKNYWHCDNEQGVGGYLAYPTAIKNLEAYVKPKKAPRAPKP